MAITLDIIFASTLFTREIGRQFSIREWSFPFSSISVISACFGERDNSPVSKHLRWNGEMPRKVWVPYLWDAFNKEKETDSEHSKWLHSSKTVHLKRYYDQKIISFFFFRFWKRIRLTSNWQNFELCVLSESCLFWV